MGRTFDKGLLLGLGALVSLLVLNAGLASFNTWRLREDAYQVAHTHEVIDALDELLATVTDAETGERGFLITNDKSYLKPYDDALRTLDAKVDRIERLVADNQSQRDRMPQLRGVIRDKVDELARTIALRKMPDGFDVARLEVLQHRGLQKMEAFRTVVGAMRTTEQDLLKQRQDTSEWAYLTAQGTGLLADVLGLVGVGGFALVLRRHLRTRARAAAAIDAQRGLLHATLVSIGDAVIVTDVEGRVTLLNGVAETLTGWMLSDAAGKPVGEVFHIVVESTRAPAENPALVALREDRIVGLTNHTILIARDGQEWPIDDSAAPIRDRNGEVSGVVLVFREIREQKRQAQELRRRADALKEADRRKDEFLATLAHELRNPLAPILNALQVLRLAGNNPAAMGQALPMMERQLHHLVRLIDDLMDASRISRNKLELRKERVGLTVVLQSALESSRPLIEQCGHELTVALPPQSVDLDGDPTRLAQIFANLLTNAAKYTQRGGHIWLTGERQGSDAVVTVRDTGVGIPGDMLPRVFEMFEQAAQSLDRSQGGLGIGLTLVRRLTEMHGGSVEAQSDGPGKGSSFVVRLPVVLTPPDPKKPAPADGGASIPARAKGRVLVVDDNKDAALSLAILLQMVGYEVVMAHDGVEAVERATAFRPDVALLDIGLPKLNGYEVAERIRSQPWGKQVFLIATTGWGQDEDRRRSQVAGFDQHLVKPVDPAALQQLLTELRPASS